MKGERSVLRNWFIIICLFIPCVIIVLTSAVVSLLRKVCAYVQRELEKFNDIHGENTPAKHRMDPAFIAYIKGEDTKTAAYCPQRTSEIVESRHPFKNTTQKINNKKAWKRKKNTSTSKKRNKSRIKIHPPPVEELILRNSISSVCRTESVGPSSTRVPQQVLSGINVAKTLSGGHNIFDCCQNTSASEGLKRKSELHHDCLSVVDSLLLLPQKICAILQRTLEGFSEIHEGSMVDLPYTEPAFVAYLKGEEAAPFICSPHVIFSKSVSRKLKNIASSSDIVKSRDQHQRSNLMRQIRELYCRLTSAMPPPERYFKAFPLVSDEEQLKTMQENRSSSSNFSQKQNARVYRLHQAGTLDEAARPSKFSDVSWTALDDTVNFHTYATKH